MNIDEDPIVEEGYIFGRGICLSVFYCWCFFNEKKMGISEEHELKERDPDLDEQEIMDIREEHWKNVAKD